MKKLLGLFAVITIGVNTLLAQRSQPTIFYVDDLKGSDTANGTSESEAWQSLEKVNEAKLIPGDQVLFKRGGLWRGQLKSQSGSEAARIKYAAYGTGARPIIQGSLARDNPTDWQESTPGIWCTRNATPEQRVPRDVGIVILNHGAKWGVKKWTLNDLKSPLDYWYDKDGQRVFIVSAVNPTSLFDSIELALTQTIVLQGKGHDITYSNLMIRYGAAHGFGGGYTRRITISDCDLCWIGGGLQFWKKVPDKPDIPVRFGNAIEFWDSAYDHVVERNRIWEIYDAALTNQGKSEKNRQINIIYRDNLIWNSEYSFEFWNRPDSSITSNIVFEYNTCIDAGYGWAHSQRPDRNGSHLMFYKNDSSTSDFVIRNNIFVGATESCTLLFNDWRSGLKMHNNLYWMPSNPLLRWLKYRVPENITFTEYQKKLDLDQNSVSAEPQFVDAAKRDYRLQPGSPGTTLSSDGTTVGARFFDGFTAAELQDSFKATPRWRGFNLLGLFYLGSKASAGKFEEKDFAIIANLGFNFVRLPLDYRFWIKDDDWSVIDESKLQVLDDAVSFGRKHKLHVMLCLHRAPGYTVAQPSEPQSLFTDAEALKVCCQHWTMLARRYKGITSQDLSFNLFNEPPDIANEIYAKVAEALVTAIREEDPTRLIVADGLKWGQKPVPELFKLGIMQSARGYHPMSISHYRANWVKVPDLAPEWPISTVARSPLYGPMKREWCAPLVISNVPPCRLVLQPDMVSGACTWQFSADGKVLLEEQLSPSVDDKELWTNALYQAEWKITQGRYRKQVAVELPQGARELSIAITKGDWMGVRDLSLHTVDGQTAVLRFVEEWGVVNQPLAFNGFATGKPPFISARGLESGYDYLKRVTIEPWRVAAQADVPIVVGEFGAHNQTPHAIVLAWMEDNLRLWQAEGWGWALWNLEGAFGILDSGREDVEYEVYRGRKLDRKMLTLLQQY